MTGKIWQKPRGNIAKCVSTAWKTARWKRIELRECPKESAMWNQQRQSQGQGRDDVYSGGIQIRFTPWVSTSRIGVLAWPHPLLSTIPVNIVAWGWEEEKKEERMKGVSSKKRDKRRRRGRKGLELWAKDSGFYHHCRSSSPPTAVMTLLWPRISPYTQSFKETNQDFELLVKGKLSSVITASFVGCEHFFISKLNFNLILIWMMVQIEK